MEHFFKEIEIHNFRGFDYLKIDGLSKVNVFVGANNVGKTSILESVFMLSGMYNPIMPARINYWRSSTHNTLDATRYLFHNIDFSNKPMLQAQTILGERKMSLSPSLFVDNESATSGAGHAAIKSLNIDFYTKKENDEEEHHYHVMLYTDNSGLLQQQVDSSYHEQMSCLFIPSEKNDINALNNFVTLVKRGKRQTVVEALQAFDPNIEAIEALPDGLYLQMKNLKELLPMSMAGDGVRRVLNIISSIATENYNVVMIDEIDTGLHYSAHRAMWNAILTFIEKHDVQLFATTHNIECLQGLKNVTESISTYQPLCTVYNVANTKKNGYQAYRYSYPELKEAINNEIEIRR